MKNKMLNKIFGPKVEEITRVMPFCGVYWQLYIYGNMLGGCGLD